jgi:hypothetical protein
MYGSGQPMLALLCLLWDYQACPHETPHSSEQLLPAPSTCESTVDNSMSQRFPQADI